MRPNITGKVAIVSGANRGFGLEITRKFLASGASVVICAREDTLLQKAESEFSTTLKSGQHILIAAVDVSNEISVNLMVERTLSKFSKIDILVNNAGIYGPMGPVESLDINEWRRALEINLIGSVLMTRAVLPVMKRQKSGKIIQISGGGATQPLPNISAYASSKAAIVRFAETLAEEVRGYGVDVNSLAPGALNTRMLEEVLMAGPEVVGKDFFEKSLKQKETGGSSIDRAAELALFLASSCSDGITGKLISAAWDNWEEWPNHISELDRTDAFTLRRIVGRDRNLDWGDK
jgi:3-oxoacyl-[acyl-carrier protein] reductase